MKQVNHLHGFRVSGFFFGASPDALTASVRGQDAAYDDPDRVVGMSWQSRKCQHFGPGFRLKWGIFDWGNELGMFRL